MKKLTLARARALAKQAHGKQVTKIGEPYIEHLEAVRMGVVVLGGDIDEQIAAVLHDIVEDTKVTLADLIGEGISDKSLKIVTAITKGSGEAQEKYLARLIAAGKPTMRVKVADLLHNTRHDRMEALKAAGKDSDVRRLKRKYRPSLARLQMELGLIGKNTDVDVVPQGSSIGTLDGNKDGTYTLKPTSLIAHDWPQGWAAPVTGPGVTKDGQSKVPLAGNAYATVPADAILTVWPKEKWRWASRKGINEASRKHFAAKLFDNAKSKTGKFSFEETWDEGWKK